MVQDHTLQDIVSQWFFGSSHSMKIDLLRTAGVQRLSETGVFAFLTCIHNIAILDHMKMNITRFAG